MDPLLADADGDGDRWTAPGPARGRRLMTGIRRPVYTSLTPRPGRAGGARPASVDMAGIDPGQGPRGRPGVNETFQLDPSKKARAYSKGNRQKVALIAALAGDAELLVLDEPTSGLDPLMEAAFRECVNAERHDGRTVLLSSHILAEAEALADRVTIIRAGRSVETGTLADLRHLTRATIDAELDGPIVIDSLPGTHDAVLDGSRLRCEVDNAALTEVLRRLSAVGVRTLTCRPPTLEELFLRHYSGQGQDHPERAQVSRVR